MGYRNVTKAAQQIYRFEQGEWYDEEQVNQMTSVLAIPREVSELAWLSDWAVLHRQWTDWIDVPIQQYVVVKVGDCSFQKIILPRHVPFLRSAERFATRSAREFQNPRG